MPRDEQFLRDYFKESQEEMRWRRNLEVRLLEFVFVFYPLVVAAMVTLYQTSMHRTGYWLLSIGAALLILLVSTFITHRICAEHKAYGDIGQAIQKIWLYFRMFEPGAYLESDAILPRTLADPKTGYGRGPGYIRTLVIVWTITSGMLAIILALAALRKPQ